MTDDELVRWLRDALRPMADTGPARDLWLDVAEPRRVPARSWIDISVAAVIVTVLLMFPDWVFLLAFHL